MYHIIKIKNKKGMKMSNYIPKRIFYIWLGSSTPADVLQAIYQWKQQLPDYDIIEINEFSKQYFDFASEMENNLWFKSVYEKKMWAYAADYIRCKVLYQYGGIYLDTDISIHQSFDDILSEPAFIGKESSNRVGFGVMGCHKNNPFIRHVLDFYSEDIWTQPIYTIPQIATRVLANCYNHKLNSDDGIVHLADITIFPEKWFYPYEYHSKYSDNCLTAESYTIHWWKESWCKPEINRWLRSKHLRPKEQIIKEELFLLRRIYLFGFIRLFDYSTKTGWVYISGIKLPLLKIKPIDNRVKIKLFNLITLFKIR